MTCKLCGGRREILMLFSYVPCECVAPSGKSEALKRAIQCSPRTLEDSVIEWYTADEGHALAVVARSSRAAFVDLLRRTIDVTAAYDGKASFVRLANGRRIYLYSVVDDKDYARGLRVARAWVHCSASDEWLDVARACVADLNGVVMEFA